MKRFYQLLMISLLIISLAVVSFGCTSKESAVNNNENENTQNGVTDPPKETVTIEFWHTYSDTETPIFEEQIIPLFEEKYPYIKVNSTKMPYDGLKQQVIAGVAGDAAPDLMRMDIIWVPEFAKLGALVPLDNLVNFSTLKDQLFPGPLATNFYNGKYYGLPLNTNTKVAIYNKALLAEAGLSEPPKTFDQLISAAETLKAKGKFGIGVGGVGPWGSLPYFWTLGGSITDDKYTKATGFLNSPDSIAALQKIVDLKEQGLIAPSLLGGEPGTWDGIKESYLMIEDGPWFFSILGDAVKDITTVATFPAGKGGSISVVGGEDLVMFSTSKHQEEAWTFMQFLMTEEPQILMSQTGLIPTNAKAANSEKVLSVPFIGPYIEQIKTAKPRTPHPSWGKIEETLTLYFEKAVRGELAVKDALDQAAQEIDGFLK